MASSSHRVFLSPPPIAAPTGDGIAPIGFEQQKSFSGKSDMKFGVQDVISPVLQKRKHVESADAATPSSDSIISIEARSRANDHPLKVDKSNSEDTPPAKRQRVEGAQPEEGKSSPSNYSVSTSLQNTGQPILKPNPASASGLVDPLHPAAPGNPMDNDASEPNNLFVSPNESMEDLVYSGIRSANIKVKAGRTPFAIWSKIKRAEAKELLRHLSPKDRQRRLYNWWRDANDEIRVQYTKLSNEDRIRYNRQTAVADLVNEIVSTVAGEVLTPRSPEAGHFFPDPSDQRRSSARSPSSSTPVSALENSDVLSSNTLDALVPQAVANVVYPSIDTGASPEIVGTLFDCLELCSHQALNDPSSNPIPSTGPGLWYSITVSQKGPLGLSIKDGLMPGRGYSTDAWVPFIDGCSADSECAKLGKKAAPGGIQHGDVMTHIGGVSLLGMNMDSAIGIIVGFASTRPVKITFFRHVNHLVRSFDNIEGNALAASRNNQWLLERASAQSKMQELQDETNKLREKNAALRRQVQSSMQRSMLARKELSQRVAKLQGQVTAYQSQLRKQNLGALKAISDQTAMAVSQPQRNAGIKGELEQARKRLHTLEARLEKRMTQESRLREILPKRFRKSIAKLLRGKMDLPAAALVADGVGASGVRTEIMLPIEGLSTYVFKALFGNRGKLIGPSNLSVDGSSSSEVGKNVDKVRKTLSVSDVESIFRINASREMVVKMGKHGGPPRRYRIELIERGGAAMVITYSPPVQQLKLTSVIEATEVSNSFASLGKNVRM